MLATYRLFYSRWRTHAVCKYACVFSAAVDPTQALIIRRSRQGSKSRILPSPLVPARPKAARSGSFAGGAARSAHRACRRSNCCCGPSGRERIEGIALSGAVATGIDIEKAQYGRSIVFLTRGTGFAVAAAAGQGPYIFTADITWIYLVRSARLSSFGSPQPPTFYVEKLAWAAVGLRPLASPTSDIRAGRATPRFG